MERRKARSDMWLAIALGLILVLTATVAAGVYYMKNRRRKEKLAALQSHIDGIEQERGRLAKDLHDGICNDLYGIEMLLQADTSREELLTDIEKIRTEVRRISHEMMPPALLDVNLDEGSARPVYQNGACLSRHRHLLCLTPLRHHAQGSRTHILQYLPYLPGTHRQHITSRQTHNFKHTA